MIDIFSVKNLSVEDRIFKAKMPHIDLDVAKELSEDLNPFVRENLAKNTRYFTVLDKLSRDEYSTVRVKALFNKKATKEMINRLALDPDPEVRAKACLSAKCTSETLAKLAGEEHSKVRFSLFKNKNTPKEVIYSISLSFHHQKLRNLARYTKNIHTLQRLVAEEMKYAGEFIPANALATEDMLRKCFTGLKKKQHDYLPYHKECPAEVLEKMYDYAHPTSLLMICGHKNTPIHILKKIALDGAFFQQIYILRNPSIPVELLYVLSCSSNKQISNLALQKL